LSFDWGSQYDTDYLDYRVLDTASFAFFDQSQFSITWVNNSDAFQDGFFMFFFSTAADPLAPVPEPEAYALLLCGLGLVICSVRRARRQAAIRTAGQPGIARR